MSPSTSPRRQPGVATLLARGARAGGTRSNRIFEMAVGVEPQCALAWLWLASVTERRETADARIDHALGRNVGPPPARMACGELLMALALARRIENPAQARSILLEASRVLPRDSRVWVLMATTVAQSASRVPYLERACQLTGAIAERARQELRSAMVDTAVAHLRAERAGNANDLLLRAAEVEPSDARIWAAAAQLASTPNRAKEILRHAVSHHKGNIAVLVQLQGDRPSAFRWGVRVEPGAIDADEPRDRDVLGALVALSDALRPPNSILTEYASLRTSLELLRSAARWTDLWAKQDAAATAREATRSSTGAASVPEPSEETWPWPAESTDLRHGK